jgi:SulP family sulfate permease
MKFTMRFNPKIYELKNGYSSNRFFQDVGAGLTVSVVALPLAMAFAIASGLKPEAGLFTAIIGGLLISLFSGSRVQVGGPAGAFIVIVYGIVQQYGVEGLLLATLMSGVLLWLMGFLRLGGLVEFIPVSVIIGFTNGIAVLIGLSQVKDFFGLSVQDVPADFFPMMQTLWQAMPQMNLQALLVALVCLLIVVLWQRGLVVTTKFLHNKQSSSLLPQAMRFLSLIPGSIVALIVGVLLVQTLDLQVETIGSRFGGIPQGLPELTVPAFSFSMMGDLMMPAITLAVLGAIESLLCARVADNMIKDKHDPNQELLTQGFANMVVPFFGGMPATGTIARTVTNVKNGATSPIAGIVHALALLVVVLVAAPLAQYIPLAALSAILMSVAWNMGAWREFYRLRTYRPTYALTLLSVFFLTVMVSLTVAVQVGIVLACFTFIYRISALTVAEKHELPMIEDKEGVRAYRLVGSVFFGSVKLIDQLLNPMATKALVLDFSGIIYIDSSGVHALKEMLHEYQERGVPIFVYGLRAQPKNILWRTEWLRELGVGQLYESVDDVQKALNALQHKQEVKEVKT